MNNLQGKKSEKLNKADKADTKLKKSKKTVEKRVAKNKEAFLKIFRDNIAIITTSCLKAKISRETFYDWCKSDKKFKKRVGDIRGEQASQVEDRLMKAVLCDNVKAIIFYLQSKHPEYKKKQVIDLGSAGGNAFKMEISVVENKNAKN